MSLCVNSDASPLPPAGVDPSSLPPPAGEESPPPPVEKPDPLLSSLFKVTSKVAKLFFLFPSNIVLFSVKSFM